MREQNMREAAMNASTRLSGDLTAKEDSLAVMEDAMTYFYRRAVTEMNKGEKAKDDLVRAHIMDMASIARNVLPHRHPTLAAIHASTSKQTALQRPGATEREVYAEVMAEIAEIVESGELPRSVKAYLSNGSGKNGGVANRNAD